MSAESPKPAHPNAQETGGVSSRIMMFIVYPAAVIVMVYVGLYGFRPQTPPQNAAPTKAPPLEAEGWYNGPGPTPAEMEGKVVVVDFWAFWCKPCFEATPELVQLHEKYKSNDKFILIGLCQEGRKHERQSRAFMDAAHISWPCGFGATTAFNDYQVQYIPTVCVLNPQGQLTWCNKWNTAESLDDAVARALSERPALPEKNEGDRGG